MYFSFFFPPTCSNDKKSESKTRREIRFLKICHRNQKYPSSLFCTSFKPYIPHLVEFGEIKWRLLGFLPMWKGRRGSEAEWGRGREAEKDRALTQE